MRKRSAGLLTYREVAGGLEVFLVHPGGPFFEKRDLAVWSLPKGEYKRGDDPFVTALREYEEETGFKPSGDFFPLGELRQSTAKIVTAWAFRGDFAPDCLEAICFQWSGLRARVLLCDFQKWIAAPGSLSI